MSKRKYWIWIDLKISRVFVFWSDFNLKKRKNKSTVGTFFVIYSHAECHSYSCFYFLNGSSYSYLEAAIKLKKKKLTDGKFLDAEGDWVTRMLHLSTAYVCVSLRQYLHQCCSVPVTWQIVLMMASWICISIKPRMFRSKATCFENQHSFTKQNKIHHVRLFFFFFLQCSFILLLLISLQK